LFFHLAKADPAKEKGTYYTPYHLVEMLMDEVLPWEGMYRPMKILEIITSSLIQFDVSFLPQTQKGAKCTIQNEIVKRYGIAPVMVGVKADSQGFINID
jgi:hypothetical protein